MVILRFGADQSWRDARRGLANYADKLKEVNGRLYLTGIGDEAYEQIVRTGKLRLTGPVRVYEATPIRGESTRRPTPTREHGWSAKIRKVRQTTRRLAIRPIRRHESRTKQGESE